LPSGLVFQSFPISVLKSANAVENLTKGAEIDPFQKILTLSDFSDVLVVTG
jgi:hypothetical protein